MATLSKGAFAKHIGVSAGRVSQYIAEGKLTADALEGEGRFAKIIVDVAVNQLRERLDLGQMLGNGVTTELNASEPDDAPLLRQAAIAPARNPIDEALRRERLEDLQRRNRIARREELADQGVYVPTADAKAAMSGALAAMLTTFEGGLADFAEALAAEYQLPQRDVLHLLRTQFRALRAKAAEAARRRAAALDETLLDAAPAEPIDQAA